MSTWNKIKYVKYNLKCGKMWIDFCKIKVVGVQLNKLAF